MEPELHNGTSKSQPSFVYCTRCGNLCNSQGSFCTGCGNALNIVEQQSAAPKPINNYYQQQNNTQLYGNSTNQTSYSYSDVYLNDEDAYIQKNNNYYKTKFAKMKQNNSKVSWNWCAFLFTSAWLIYRKMYALGFGLFVFEEIITYGGIVLAYLYLSPSYDIVTLLIIIGIALTFGLTGNYIYKTRIDKLIYEGQKLDEPFKTKHIEKNGGVSLTVLIISIVVLTILHNILRYYLKANGYMM